MGSVFSAIGHGLSAVISAIANVLMTIVNAITSVSTNHFGLSPVTNCAFYKHRSLSLSVDSSVTYFAVDAVHVGEHAVGEEHQDISSLSDKTRTVNKQAMIFNILL